MNKPLKIVTETLAKNHDDDLLRIIAEGTASSTGAEFFRALVRNLAMALGVRYAFVAEFTAARTSVRTLAFWSVDHFLDNFEYALEGSICAPVLAGEIRCYRTDVGNLFPADAAAVQMGLESYLAVPLMDRNDQVMGHLAVCDTKTMDACEREFTLFRIFAARASAELERQRSSDALAKNERRLGSILGSAMDAIIAFDEARHITLFNPAAERIFRCARDWALGQPFDRFLSRRFRSLLENYLQGVRNGAGTATQLWAPDGLTAQRATGEEFPIEATLSPVDLDGARLYTLILRDVNERQRIEAELANLKTYNAYLTAESNALPASGIIGESPVMRRLLEDLHTVAATDTTVLVQGETGTGKELIAHALHAQSPRADKPLVKLNCAALPAELIESELFGHEKGAFTGATAQRTGRFELAHGGTLFLDEVGELTLPAQAKLLRVLQDRSFERVGGTRTLTVDVRVITATNRDLAAQVAAGEFRSDLYYRLAVFPIEVPPLRERGEDVILLARHFLKQTGRKLGRLFTDFAPPVIERMGRYSWPGNIRELANLVERAALLARSPMISDLGIPEPTFTAVADDPTASMADVQRTHIVRVLEACAWRIEGPNGGAVRLGMEPSTLRYRMQKLGIRRPRRTGL